MIQKVLTNCLKPIIVAETRLRNMGVVTAVLLAGTIGALLLLAIAFYSGWWSRSAIVALFSSLLVLAGAGFIWSSRKTPNLRDLAKQVEEKHPDLRVALLTAMSQEPDEDGKLGYLQSRVLSDVTEHAVKNQWVRQVSEKRLKRAGWWQILALIAFSSSFLFLLKQSPKPGTQVAEKKIAEKIAVPEIEIVVTPGDTEVEKGKRLVVEATFIGRLPEGATLIISDPGGKERGRVPMNPSIDDSVFSALIAKVDSDALYRIDFEELKSPIYTITTYEHPKLEQADATVTPPAYVGSDSRTIEDTRKVSLLEGSDLEWSLKINKPTAAAELFGEDESVIPLRASKTDPSILIADYKPDKTKKYRLHLVDNEDRVNKRPPWFTVTVKKNLPPKLDFIFPKRDVDVSAIQELPIEAKVWDDIAVLKAGVMFQFGEAEKDMVMIDAKRAGGKHHLMNALYAVEKLGAKPRDLISYHLWAEDIGPDGKNRRISSDMFFAEVRHFEDIFKEAQSQGGKPGENQGESQKLLKLQKDILDATWKVLRRQQMGRSIDELKEDTEVLTESQNIAIEKTLAAIEKVEDADLKAILNAAKIEMEKAVKSFGDVLKKGGKTPLSEPYKFVRKAYEKLIQARAREHRITQSQKPSKGGKPQEKEAQLMNLEMKQKSLKYKEESEAQNEEKTAEQKENLEVLNKLKELARRQEAIAEKIKELETALQEAETEEEKREIERQLKRLQEEQEQLLRETDDLMEKMDSEQNRANMADEREKLEKIRDSIREASEKLKEQKLASAANAATRAQRELEETKEEFRKKTSRQFSDEMKNIRNMARELAEKQSEISKKLDDGEGEKNEKDPFSSNPSPLENMKLSQEIDEQNKKLETMIEEIKKLSEESEVSEKLLSEALYDAVRSAMVNGVTESLDEASDLARYNQRSRARVPEQAAARGIEELKEKVESAAEKILGSEEDSLRLARSEVDKLIEQAKKEEERLGGERQKAEGKGQKGEEEMKLAMNSSSKGKKAGTKEGKADDPTGLGEKQKAEGKGQKAGEGKPGSKGKEKDGEGKETGKGEGKEGQGKGQKPGNEGKGKEPGKGEGKKGQGEGKKPGNGQGQKPGEGKGQKPGGEGKGDSPSLTGRKLVSGDGKKPGKPGGKPGGEGSASSSGNNSRGGPGMFFNQVEERREPGPITGEDFKEWANRLGNVEEMVDQEDIRNNIARVLDDARAMRIEYKRDNLPPAAGTIQKRITDPLVELRARLSEELAKLNKENPLAPIDRDPVPGEFSDLVRRYYENLGAGE